jgi:hypothetical protein
MVGWGEAERGSGGRWGGGDWLGQTMEPTNLLLQEGGYLLNYFVRAYLSSFKTPDNLR